MVVNPFVRVPQRVKTRAFQILSCKTRRLPL